jgi:hypothetical protein
MDVFAIGVLIFLLICIIALIISIVFFSGKSTSETTEDTVDNTETPGNDLDGADVDHPLSTSRRHWRNFGSNIDESTRLSFLNELYDQISRSGNANITTINGSHSNIYTNRYMSGASGASTGSGSNAYWNNGSYANFTHQQWSQMGFSDYDMAAYSPY